ncbi:hypothetical protein DCS_01438 [Drechmeria coniospora]|uniref:Ureidoglycolate hydrolase n=1 Tax=Drechmeria coniospora TaxID=98403 RepID=A0A151GTA8_DRECN|nr:hypothetical protein DCS_01438 [Drechmeria coniospora]KYK60301.1 hypothetical protein DCS_01438 [Drechmeria coniospora]ODA80242.1 hypothetical protein RJ55_03200 [Drechmeria coniospora]
MVQTNADDDVVGTAENPYGVAIKECHDNHKDLQRLYEEHRTRRNGQQAQAFLAPDFGGLVVDEHLLRLERPLVEPGFRDERHCLVIWARPPSHVLRLAEKLQSMIRKAAPHVWLMPTYRMHLTAIEIAFAKTPAEIASLVSALRPALPTVTSYTHGHRSRLVKPLLSYDRAAFALSFLPAAGERILSPATSSTALADAPTAPWPPQADAYTYHHLRRDLFDLVRGAGLDVVSRYQVPSAHITLGRFLDESDHDTAEKRRLWTKTMDDINDWLRQEVWDRPEAEYVGEWLVGQERGLDARDGTLWYGGGRTIMMGEGF